MNNEYKKTHFYCEGGCTVEQVAQRDCRVSILGDIQNSAGLRVGQPALGKGAALDLQNSFPTSALPWLQDSVKCVTTGKLPKCILLRDLEKICGSCKEAHAVSQI